MRFCLMLAFFAAAAAAQPANTRSWSFGGSGQDSVSAVAVDAAGNTYVAGVTNSPDLPVTANALQRSYRTGICGGGLLGGPRRPCLDIFLAKFDPQGQLTYLTYLGTEGEDSVSAMAVDTSGAVYLTGHAPRSFPTTHSLAVSTHGLDEFVTKISPAGDRLIYSTRFGGSQFNASLAIAVNQSGNAYVAGATASKDFPLKNPLRSGPPEGRLFRTTDAGRNWALSATGLPSGGGVPVIAADPALPGVVYASVGGLYRSLDNGATWAGIALPGPLPGQYLSVTSVAFAGTGLYVGTFDGILVSKDRGATWSSANNGLLARQVNSLAVQPGTASMVYAATLAGLFKTANGGVSWSPTGLSEAVRTVVVAGSAIFAGTETRLMKSSDGGSTWRSLFGASGTVLAVGVDPADPRYVVAATDRSLDYQVFVSSDGGETWQDAQSGLPDLPVIALAFDPAQPGRVYAGAFNGLYSSDDRGLH